MLSLRVRHSAEPALGDGQQLREEPGASCPVVAEVALQRQLREAEGDLVGAVGLQVVQGVDARSRR